MITLHETCLQYFRRRLSEGWKCASLEGYNAVLLSPDGIRRELDLRNDVETLRPNGVGNTTGIEYQFPETGAHWEKVDEVSKDNMSTYVQCTLPLEAHYDTYALPSSGVGAGKINKVTVFAWCYRNATGNCRTFIRTVGTDYPGDNEFPPVKTWTLISTEYLLNPNTLAAWTWAQINALEIGVGFYMGDGWVFCTQVYVEVDYTPPVVAPTVTTQAADNIEQTTVNPKGNVTDTGGENPTRYIDYDTDSGASYANSKNCGVGGTGVYNSNLTGLIPGTKYYYRARAVNSGGTGTGAEMTFTTKSRAVSANMAAKMIAGKLI